MLATALVSGLSLGSIYGLIALGFTLTFAVSGTVNFAQGSSVMLGAVMCHALSIGMHWPMLGRDTGVASGLRDLGPGGRAHRGPAVRRARHQFLADGDRGARHRARQCRDGAVRQGAAGAAVRPGRRSLGDRQYRHLSVAGPDTGGRTGAGAAGASRDAPHRAWAEAQGRGRERRMRHG